MGPFNKNLIVVRGAGDMASGTIRRLFLAGFRVLALEKQEPECIRRKVCFAEAVFEKKVTVEGVSSRMIGSMADIESVFAKKEVPLLIDPEAKMLDQLKPEILVDGRMLKKGIETGIDSAPVVIGLGPGFVAGGNCHAVIETNRGFDLGRVIYRGTPQTDTARPAPVNGVSYDRVLRSPADGIFRTPFEIGDNVRSGDVVGQVNGDQIFALIDGVLRGLIRDGALVVHNQKIGDIDSRGIREYCFKISEKANAIAGGVLEAVLSVRDGKLKL